jgi:hypothetical protein
MCYRVRPVVVSASIHRISDEFAVGVVNSLARARSLDMNFSFPSFPSPYLWNAFSDCGRLSNPEFRSAAAARFAGTGQPSRCVGEGASTALSLEPKSSTNRFVQVFPGSGNVHEDVPRHERRGIVSFASGSRRHAAGAAGLL